MEIKLTLQESEDIFFDALCNAVGSGHMNGYGIRLECDRHQYKNSKEHLIRQMSEADLMAQGVCYEDVLMQVLRDGGTLTFVDEEGEGDMTRDITMKDVHKRVQKTPPQSLLNMVNETGDASDADAVIQTVFFKEIVFG